MICVLEEVKCSCKFEDIRNKLDLLSSQVQYQAKLESKHSKTLQAIFGSMSTDKGSYIALHGLSCMCIAKCTIHFTDDQNVQDENTFILLDLLLKPKAKDKVFHQLSVSYNIIADYHMYIAIYIIYIIYGLV